MTENKDQTEEELDKFRQEWRAEVTAKTKPRAPNRPIASGSASASQKAIGKSQKQPTASSSKQKAHDPHDGWDESGSNAYHDIEGRETGRRLNDDPAQVEARLKEPQTALEHYEKAVEKERIGNLGDSVSLYRKAFRMDDRVHEKYKNKHFPPSAFAKSAATGQSAATTSSKGTSTNQSHARQTSVEALPPTIAELMTQFSQVFISRRPPPTELSPLPPCPIAELPEEVLYEVLKHVAVRDVATMSKVAQICKRFAYLVMSEDRIWRRITLGPEFGLGGMHYHYACSILGKPLSKSALGEGGYSLDSALVEDERDDKRMLPLPLSDPYTTYRQMFRSRPRIRFSGCYISTVNYTRPGANNASNFTWTTPVLIVTYYRYLRFFRDGSCISLLTTSEPADVVPWLWKEHAHHNHTNTLPQSVMKDALKGRWRLSGDPYKGLRKTVPKVPLIAEDSTEETAEDGEEQEGDLIVETEGVVPKYMFKLHLGFASAGKGARNNKLNWKGFWNYNKLTDDWGEFGLKNDRPFYWSRVKSYGNGW